MSEKTRIVSSLVLFLMFGVFVWSASSMAQDYPKGPVQVVIPLGPGGSDLLWRILGDHLPKDLKVPVVDVNKPEKSGGSGFGNSVLL